MNQIMSKESIITIIPAIVMLGFGIVFAMSLSS